MDKPGGYITEFSAKDCFNKKNFSEGIKKDSLKANFLFRGQRIWRAVNLEDKSNSTTFRSGGKCTAVGLFEVIKFGLFEKKLNAFLSDEFSSTGLNPLNPAQLLTSIQYYDSSLVMTFDANGDQKQETVITKRYLTENDVKGYLIKEDWVMNSNTGKSDKHIVAIAPLVYNAKQEKTLPLFWLYYAEWTSLFSCFEARNFYSHEVISFNDVFTKRYFVSRISKTNNVFDRSVKSTHHGEDAWLENELIKEKLDHAESDLFQY